MKASFVDTDDGIVLVVSHDEPHDSVLMRVFVGFALGVESRAGKENK